MLADIDGRLIACHLYDGDVVNLPLAVGASA
jgi:hypothetical protein